MIGELKVKTNNNFGPAPLLSSVDQWPFRRGFSEQAVHLIYFSKITFTFYEVHLIKGKT